MGVPPFLCWRAARYSRGQGGGGGGGGDGGEGGRRGRISAYSLHGTVERIGTDKELTSWTARTTGAKRFKGTHSIPFTCSMLLFSSFSFCLSSFFFLGDFSSVFLPPFAPALFERVANELGRE